MPNAGDIDRTTNFLLLSVSKLATTAISKGQIVSLKDGRPWQAGDTGPFGVAWQNVANGADMSGKILVDGIVWVAAAGAIAQYAPVVPSTVAYVTTATTLTLGTGSSGGTGMTGSLMPGGMILGTAWDAAVNSGDLLRISLYA